MKPRLTSIDAIRGLVMVIMALDHTREYFTDVPFNPLDPARTNAALFLTRWITHLCAPTFVFLAGTSIFLQSQRKTMPELARRLFWRGLWFMLCEVTLIHLVFSFNWKWNVQLLEVIWAIGLSMVAMAALIRLSPRVNSAIGAVLVCGHNALDGIGVTAWWWKILHVPGVLAPPAIIVAYPVLPWIGVMALGYGLGPWLTSDRPRVALAGAGLLAGFALLRWTNVYGDPLQWSVKASAAATVFSFLNVQKYPPSLLFLMATLGASAVAMAMLRRWPAVQPVLAVYGRVPFFYFVVHIALIHALAVGATAIAGLDWKWWFRELPDGGVFVGRPAGFGYGLAGVWSIWIFVVAACYPLCRWWAKQR